ncbi:hypothetical protein KIN20_005274 [Parelaphostrongylus tenuis]|uniref:Uncharacterized protein n=1 Tax=Parelaphostrongylus tenuis TaxID=148309 RepID=A0AAD5MI74_PARTN|nr:hypothetical protein KIN20_005274 [Parelaphostrongylus tenuis]
MSNGHRRTGRGPIGQIQETLSDKRHQDHGSTSRFDGEELTVEMDRVGYHQAQETTVGRAFPSPKQWGWFGVLQ